MNLTNARKRLKNEQPVSAFFPITHLNSPSVFETQNGQMGSVIKVEGVPFITELNTVLNQHSHRLHQAVLGLDESFMLYVTVHRKKENTLLNGHFSSPFARQVDHKYHERFQGKNTYHNHFYLTIVLKGNTSGKTNKLLHWASKAAGRQLTTLHAAQRHHQLTRLADVCEHLLGHLADFKPHRLGCFDRQLGFSELLAFLSLVPNAGRAQCHNAHLPPPVITKGKQAIFNSGIYPKGHLGQYLCNHRLFFGTHLQWDGLNESDRCFGAMLSVKNYPQDTGCVMLDPLLEVDSEFIATHSFAPEARLIALEAIRLKRDKLDAAEDKGQSDIEALSQLEDEIASSRVSLGYHHNTVMVFGESLEIVEGAVQEVKKAYSHSNTHLVKETLSLELPFWAQIPGNSHFIARSALITSRNFSHLCALHNYQHGYYNSNHLGQAVTLLETPSKTSVYFNYHAKGSKTNPSKGHAAIFGANDAGKTTLVCFLDAQMNRYGGRSFFIDRDESSKIYILASGNSRYTVIAPQYANTLAMNPLQMPDSPDNRSFLKKWMAYLLMRANESDLPSSVLEQVNECIDYNYEQLEPAFRTLSHLSRYFPVNFERWPELRRWLKAYNGTTDGEFAWLFDNPCDALALGFDKVGFDVTYLMDEVTPLISTPVYLYLVHRMRQCLDGRLTTFIFDEAWQVLKEPFWVEYFNKALPTIRKLNGHFIFMTQSPQTVVNSPLRATLIDNASTLIYFPNPQAEEAVYIDALKLTMAEYQTIKNNAASSRLFLYKQGQESMLCNLDLSNLQDELRVFSGNKEAVRLLDALIEEHGPHPEIWLPHFIKRSNG